MAQKLNVLRRVYAAAVAASLRTVQDMLGHQDPETSACYARVVDRAKTNPALKVPVDL